MIGSSVVPGLPNILVTPSSASTRRKASRPVIVLVTADLEMGVSGIVSSLEAARLARPWRPWNDRVGEGCAVRKDDLESKLARLACWRGPVTLEPLKGGLTNLSYVADDGREKFVVRCGADIPVHHVFRDRERAASMAAFEAGLSPGIIHAEPGIMVLHFIAGRTFGEADLAANIDRIVP